MLSASAWATPPTRTELIENLVSGVGAFHDIYLRLCTHLLSTHYADRYNPNNVGILEDYLYHQIRSEEYDCLANLAILKLCAIYFIPANLRTDLLASKDINSTRTYTIPTSSLISSSKPSPHHRFPTLTSAYRSWTNVPLTRIQTSLILSPRSSLFSPTSIACCNNAAFQPSGPFTDQKKPSRCAITIPWNVLVLRTLSAVSSCRP